MHCKIFEYEEGVGLTLKLLLVHGGCWCTCSWCEVGEADIGFVCGCEVGEEDMFV